MRTVDPKPAAFLASSQGDIAQVPKFARSKAGKDIQELQHGRMPPDWKPMHSVGAGVGEIRILGTRSFRVLIIARFHEPIYILHDFEKRSRKTPVRDIELGRAWFRALIRSRG